MSNANITTTFPTAILRDGLPPISYRGVIIASRSNKTNNSTRWSTWTIHRTTSGKLILETVCRSQWENERDRHLADVYKDAASLCAAVKDKGAVPDELNELLAQEFPMLWSEFVE